MSNARTLPEATTSRRAVLGAVLAAGAIGVAPIVGWSHNRRRAVSGPAGLDAGLFALIDRGPRGWGAPGGGCRCPEWRRRIAPKKCRGPKR